jgi:hypothetical protein
MELEFDWKKVQALLGTRTKAPKVSPVPAGAEVIVRGEWVLAAYSENESLGDWVGKKFEDLKAAFPNHPWVVRSEADWEKVLEESYRIQSWQAQVESVQESCPYQLSGQASSPHEKGKDAGKVHRGRVPLTVSQGPLWQRHFLIDGLQSGLGRLLPEKFGLLIEVLRPGRESQLAYLWVYRGKLMGFHEPDLSGLSLERRDDLESTAKYLTEKYAMRSLYLSVPEARWQAWKDSALPWRLLSQDLRAGVIKVAPKSFGLRAWTFLRGAMGG